MIRILLFTLLISIIQISLYCLSLKVIQLILSFFELDGHQIIDDYSIYISSAIFIMIILIQNTTVSIINKKWFTWIAVGCSTIFYIIGWGEDINSWPISTIIFLLFGVITLISKFFIDQRLTRLLSRKNKYC